jgi:hypothetical protein
VPDVVGHIRQADPAAARARRPQQGRDVRPLHEAVPGSGAPEAGRNFFESRRVASSIHGTASVRTVSTKRRSCRARLCFKCHTITGGASRSVRVRNTAAPGTRGILPSAIRAMKVAIGSTVSWSRAETACACAR